MHEDLSHDTDSTKQKWWKTAFVLLTAGTIHKTRGRVTLHFGLGGLMVPAIALLVAINGQASHLVEGTPSTFVALAAIVVFGSVVAHEVGHAAAAVHSTEAPIDVYVDSVIPSVGVENIPTKDKLFIALAGPLVSAAFMVVFGILWVISSGPQQWVMGIACVANALQAANGIPSRVFIITLLGTSPLIAIYWGFDTAIVAVTGSTILGFALRHGTVSDGDVAWEAYLELNGKGKVDASTNVVKEQSVRPTTLPPQIKVSDRPFLPRSRRTHKIDGTFPRHDHTRRPVPRQHNA